MDAVSFINLQMLNPSSVLNITVKPKYYIFVCVWPIRNFNSIVLQLPSIQSLQANNLERSSFCFLTLAADYNIPNLKAIHFAFQLATLNPSAKLIIDLHTHVPWLAFLYCPNLCLKCWVIAFEKFFMFSDPVAKTLVAKLYVWARFDI